MENQEAAQSYTVPYFQPWRRPVFWFKYIKKSAVLLLHIRYCSITPLFIIHAQFHTLVSISSDLVTYYCIRDNYIRMTTNMLRSVLIRCMSACIENSKYSQLFWIEETNRVEENVELQLNSSLILAKFEPNKYTYFILFINHLM